MSKVASAYLYFEDEPGRRGIGRLLCCARRREVITPTPLNAVSFTVARLLWPQPAQEQIDGEPKDKDNDSVPHMRGASKMCELMLVACLNF